MRRLALFALAGLAVVASAEAPDYLRLRAQSGIHQASVPAALREVLGTKTLELQGHVTGTCQSGDTTLLLVQQENGETQAVEAKTPPAWLLDESGSIRILVRCERQKSGALKATLLAAAPELDVVKVEEAYWSGLAKQRQTTLRPRTTGRTLASRGGGARAAIYGRIGGRSYAVRGGDVRPPQEVVESYAAFMRHHNPRLSVAQARGIADSVVRISLHENVDMRLVMAVLIVESGFNPNAVSRAGAVGLGQLMPGTARGLGVHNSYDAADNLSGAIRLLRGHLGSYGGDLVRTLAAYNAGAGAVARHGGVPPYRETQNYVLKVIATYRKLCGA